MSYECYLEGRIDDARAAIDAARAAFGAALGASGGESHAEVEPMEILLGETEGKSAEASEPTDAERVEALERELEALEARLDREDEGCERLSAELLHLEAFARLASKWVSEADGEEADGEEAERLGAVLGEMRTALKQDDLDDIGDKWYSLSVDEALEIGLAHKDVAAEVVSLRSAMAAVVRAHPELMREYAECEQLASIRAEQVSTDLICDRDAFGRLCREIVQSHEAGDMRLDEEAVEVLQTAAEEHLMKVLGGSVLLAAQAERTYVVTEDVRQVRRLCADKY